MKLEIYTLVEKATYGKYLIERFGGVVAAANVIDEMLKIVPQGTMELDLKRTREMLFNSIHNNS